MRCSKWASPSSKLGVPPPGSGSKTSRAPMCMCAVSSDSSSSRNVASSGVRCCAIAAPFSCVEGVDHVRVPSVDHAALDLERRRELAAGLGQLVLQEGEALHLLDAREVRVHLVHDLLELRPDPLVVSH